MHTHHTSVLITPTPPAGEEARVAGILNAVQQNMGFVPDAMRLFGVSPALLETFMTNITYFQNGTRLSPRLTTLIRYLVSSQSNCSFCIDMNEGFLTQMGEDLETVRSARTDSSKAPVDARERPLLLLALKAIRDPEAVDSGDVNAAREEGWTERDIFDAVAVASFNKALNHLLKSFKVEHQGAFA
jgi:alkylhydroperoxidase family enzyme